MTNNPRIPPGRFSASAASDASARSASVGSAVSYSPSFASPVPLIAGIVSLLASVILVFVGMSVGESTVLLPQPRFELTLPQAEYAFIGWVGYLLTPIGPIVALVVDRVLQGRGLANPQFVPRSIFGIVLKLVAAAGIAVSLWHIVAIAVPLVELVQELGQ